MVTRAQHYVTQGYLRQFASRVVRKKKRKQAYIHSFRLSDQSVVERPIEKVACDDWFYDYVEIDGTPVSLEEEFQSMETKFIPRLRIVCEESSAEAMDYYRTDLSYFAASQLLRTPAFRVYQEQVWELVYGIDVRQGRPSIGPADDLVKLVSGRFVRHHLHDAAAILHRKGWILLHNPNDEPFYTSDNPVALLGRNVDDLEQIVGLERPGVLIYVPLDPRTALLLCDAAEAPRPAERTANAALARALNRHQVMSAEERVFAHTDDFTTARELLAEHPEAAQRPRVRVKLAS